MNKTNFFDVKHLTKQTVEDESDMQNIVQNMHVILNPGFCDTDDQRAPLSPIKTNFYGYTGYHHDSGYHHDELKEDITFGRRMSIFFTGNTIKRI